jgi:AraC-like DNA-binding protein
MAVSARPANVPTATASLGLVDMRDGAPVRAGTFTYDAADLVTGWHTHDLHQIEYAFEGIAEVETADVRYLLPPQQAMWIPAGCSHCTTLQRVRSIAVFFDPAMVPDVDGRARVLAAAPVLREMVVYATRWPISRPVSDAAADAFFEALAVVTRECLAHEAPLALPTSADPVIGAVMDRTRADLATASARSVARAVGISERTLRRQFLAETGMTWSRYLLATRILRSMALLTEGHHTITAIALDVGFDSASSFTRSFRRFTGETPTRYRARVRQP